MKYTDDDIITAYGYCLSHDCRNCPLDGVDNCMDKVEICIPEIYNRQKAEIESLKIAIEVTRDNLGDARAELQKAESEIERLKGMVSQNEGVLPQYEALVRDEAIKEFAERLKKRKYQSSEWSHGEHPYVVEKTDIDDVLEEMTEEYHE